MTGDASTRDTGFRVLRFGAIDSTMSEARRRADDGDPGGLWIVADTQEAGRGRRGRQWTSPPGNLYATILLRDPCPPPRLGELCFVAGLALRDAVMDVAGPAAGERLTLKWPNDLLVGNAKTAGILVESAGPPARLADAVAIGFGVNCATSPEGTPYPVTSLAASGLDVAPAPLFDALERDFAARFAAWSRPGGFDEIRHSWLLAAARLGMEIAVTLGQDTLRGRFETITEDGRLALRLPEGSLRLVSAGEVVFARPAADLREAG